MGSRETRDCGTLTGAPRHQKPENCSDQLASPYCVCDALIEARKRFCDNGCGKKSRYCGGRGTKCPDQPLPPSHTPFPPTTLPATLNKTKSSKQKRRVLENPLWQCSRRRHTFENAYSCQDRGSNTRNTYGILGQSLQYAATIHPAGNNICQI